jgi:phosphonate transport system permease protein
VSSPRAWPEPRPVARRFPPRALLLAGLLAAGLLAWLALDAPLAALVPHAGGLEIARGFFGAALSPALEYEQPVPAGTPPILVQALVAAKRTLAFAAGGMSLALALGVVLGFLSSSSWWAGAEASGASAWRRLLGRALGPAVWSAARALTVGMRSVHELLWAVLFLAAFGLNSGAAVLALAIPYAGTLAKVFSEMVEEAPRDAALALRGLGARPLAVFCFALVPRALPDLASYSFYRFECSVRSAAVLGFFGFPTLGYSILQAFENLHYAETWTYLYTLLALVLAIELWSGALRRRFVA